MNRLLAWMWLLAMAPGAQAATFAVSRTDDPAPNGCVSGDCSLREAVLAANANANDDVIQLPIGVFVLPNGALTISNNVEIRGSTSPVSRIEGNGTQLIFDVTGSPVVLLANLTLDAFGAHSMHASRHARITLDQVKIQDADSQIFVDSAAAGTGTFEVRRSEIRSYLSCGSVALCRISDSLLLRLQVGSGNGHQTQVEIIDSSIDGDVADDGSGVVMQTNASISIINSSIVHTNIGLLITAGTPSQITIAGLSYVDNDGPLRVNVPTSVTLQDSEFRSNVSDVFEGGPGAIYARGGSDWEISGSTFDRNTGEGTVGGAILVEQAASMSIRNSTFSGNTFTVTAAGNGARGAAIGFRSDPAITSLSLRHVTIVRPTIAPTGIVGTAIGGIGNETGLVLSLINTIVSGTCALETDAMDANFGNIESPGNTCDLSGATNFINTSITSLAIGTLADHGGPTQTYEPASTSRAVDSANQNFCVTTDQRGYLRPSGAGCDTGATEVGALTPEFRNGFE